MFSRRQSTPGTQSRLSQGYTIDTEGHLNVYAIEPEMYINEPGDLRRQRAEEIANRRRELQALQEDETWNLTMEHDFRHKGPGLV